MTAGNATNLVVGRGDYVYDVLRPWGVLPPGWTFGLISHVAVDSRDQVYFYQRMDAAGTVDVTDRIPRLTMFSPEGRRLARGRPVTQGAHGVGGDSRGDLSLAEAGLDQVIKLVRRRRAGE